MENLALTILSSVGGTALLVAGLSNWLGKVWADRILEKDKAKYQKELEKIKRDYEVHFEGVKAVLLRYSENQFDIYRQLWASLCELKLAADNLWAMANLDRIADFSNQLNKTKFWLEQSSLFVEDIHYHRLNNTFISFEDFLFGKGMLLGLRNDPTLTKAEAEERIRTTIQNNRYCREQFTTTLSELREYFKAHISGQTARQV